jgi:hypothetical protein
VVCAHRNSKPRGVYISNLSENILRTYRVLIMSCRSRCCCSSRTPKEAIRVGFLLVASAIAITALAIVQELVSTLDRMWQRVLVLSCMLAAFVSLLLWIEAKRATIRKPDAATKSPSEYDALPSSAPVSVVLSPTPPVPPVGQVRPQAAAAAVADKKPTGAVEMSVTSTVRGADWSGSDNEDGGYGVPGRQVEYEDADD